MMLLIIINSSSNSLLGLLTNQIELLRLADVALGNVDDAGLDPSKRWASAVQSHGASQVADLFASPGEPAIFFAEDEHLDW